MLSLLGWTINGSLLLLVYNLIIFLPFWKCMSLLSKKKMYVFNVWLWLWWTDSLHNFSGQLLEDWFRKMACKMLKYWVMCSTIKEEKGWMFVWMSVKFSSYEFVFGFSIWPFRLFAFHFTFCFFHSRELYCIWLYS